MFQLMGITAPCNSIIPHICTIMIKNLRIRVKFFIGQNARMGIA